MQRAEAYDIQDKAEQREGGRNGDSTEGGSRVKTSQKGSAGGRNGDNTEGGIRGCPSQGVPEGGSGDNTEVRSRGWPSASLGVASCKRSLTLKGQGAFVPGQGVP